MLNDLKVKLKNGTCLMIAAEEEKDNAGEFSGFKMLDAKFHLVCEVNPCSMRTGHCKG